MKRLLEAVTALVSLVSPDKVGAIADRVRRLQESESPTVLAGLVGTPLAADVISRLIAAWRETTVPSGELATMLLAASHAHTAAISEQSIELVWTGPTTPIVAARRTEQALLQVINAARTNLFVTSFVAYDVASIVRALNTASERGVEVSMLLESSQDHGGSMSFDVIGKMRSAAPRAKLYAWRDRADIFADGRVHAKVAVADESICFITSANLTGHAMEKNMEAGVLITGTNLSKLLSEHLRALVAMRVVADVTQGQA